MIMLLIPGLNLYAQDSDAPDMVLLEFIGDGVNADNDVIDPISWRDMEVMTRSDQVRSQQSGQTRKKTPQDSRQQGNE